MPSKSENSQAIKQPFINPAFSQSPESSSASDSSNNRHKRNHSSDSSRSGALAGDGDIPINAILIGADKEDQTSDKSSPATDVDLSNRAMECHFDFDSAASSPSTFSEVKTAFKPSSIRSIRMPYRSSPNAGLANVFGSYPTASKVSHYWEKRHQTDSKLNCSESIEFACNVSVVVHVEAPRQLASRCGPFTGTVRGPFQPVCKWRHVERTLSKARLAIQRCSWAHPRV